MKECYGQSGWREFHRNRKDILSEFDRLIELTVNRPVKTAHGTGIEAYLRKWLSEFLPKKYGVTSGYIIPTLFTDNAVLRHFDVIIYDQLEAPVLWTEGNEDNSEQGKFLAIPARHVAAVFEVKSRLTKATAKDALEKLGETRAFAEQLKPNYFCKAIFIELKSAEVYAHGVLNEFLVESAIPGFAGGMVLRYAEDDGATGLITVYAVSEAPETDNFKGLPLVRPMDALDIRMQEDGSVRLNEIGATVALVCTAPNQWSVSKGYSFLRHGSGSSVSLSWSRTNFSSFCVDVICRLEGVAHDDAKRPSFGMIFDSLERAKAPSQPDTPLPDMPFIVIKLRESAKNGELLSVDTTSVPATVEYWLELCNEGTTSAVISDDFFKTSAPLPPKHKAIKAYKYEVRMVDDNAKVGDFLQGEALRIPFRLVYRVGEEKETMYAVEATVVIRNSAVSLE